MRKGLILAALTLLPTAALAHPGPLGHAHALGSLDVLLAIAAVGLLALAWRVNQATR